MKLYICFGTGGNDHHACAKAYKALKANGYVPDLVKVHGSGYLPKLLQGKKRKTVKDLTGNYFVPTLVLDNGEIVDHADNIVNWASRQKASIKT